MRSPSKSPSLALVPVGGRGVGVGLGLGVGVGLGLGVAVGLGLGVAVGLGLGVAVGLGLGVGVGLGLGVGVGLGLGVGVGLGLGVGVGLGLGVGVGVGVAPPVTERLRVFCTVLDAASLRRTVKLNDPPDDGIPLIVPPEFRFNPGDQRSADQAPVVWRGSSGPDQRH